MERGILKHAFILAGGRSRRFGSDKTALQRNGRLVLADVVAMLQGLNHDVTILGPDTGHLTTLSCRIIPDKTAYDGALPAIIQAFDIVQCDRALVVAADMPFLNPDVVQLMWRHETLCDIVTLEGGIFPAIYSSRALSTMQELATTGCRRFQDLYNRLAAVTHVIPKSQWCAKDPEELSLRNVNTLADWRLVCGC